MNDTPTITCRDLEAVKDDTVEMLLYGAAMSVLMRAIEDEYGAPSLFTPGRLTVPHQRKLSALMASYAKRHLDEPAANAVRSAVVAMRASLLPRAKPTVQ
jgi:hypothetical protein